MSVGQLARFFAYLPLTTTPLTDLSSPLLRFANPFYFVFFPIFDLQYIGPKRGLKCAYCVAFAL